jgi:hypothetical protein
VLTEACFCSVCDKTHRNVGYGIKNTADGADKTNGTRLKSLNKSEKLLMIFAQGICDAADGAVGNVVADYRSEVFQCVAFYADNILDFISESQGYSSL